MMTNSATFFLFSSLSVLMIVGINGLPLNNTLPNSFTVPRPFIVGGEEATRNEFPFLVHLLIRTPQGTFLCGGTLIDMDAVLTAAHCIYGVAPGNVQVTAGDHDLSRNDGTEQVRGVKSIWHHEDYDDDTAFHDIAILTLNSPFVENSAVSWILLANPSEESRFLAWGTVAGWGATSYGGGSPDILLKADVPMVRDNSCTKQLTSSVYQFCAGSTGKDACQGDSGGPFLCYIVINDNLWYRRICGIVSFGNECGLPNWPGVYTKVSAYVGTLSRNSSLPSPPAPATFNDDARNKRFNLAIKDSF